MRIKLIEQWKFKLQGRAVPVIKVEEQDEIGKVMALHLVGPCKDRPNSIVNTWDSKGWEKDKKTEPIVVFDEKGNQSLAWIVSKKGVTVDLYARQFAGPFLEDVIGRASTMDDIADAMDLGKSIKNLAIGLFIGAGIGALILGPMLQTVLS